MDKEKILSRFLLPLDQSRYSARVVKFAGKLLPALGPRCQEVILLHILAGGYLSSHLKNVDLRAKFLVDSARFKALRAEYVNQEIRPFLDDHARAIKDLGTSCSPEVSILDGDPSHEILSVVSSRGITTVMMGRRGLNALEGIIFGSLTDAMLHSEMEASLYIVGRGQDDGGEPAPDIKNILVAVDEDNHSIEALQEAGIMAGALGEGIERIIVLNVVDISNLAYDIDTEGKDLAGKTRDILMNAKRVLCDLGVPEEKLVMVSRGGRAVDCIIKEADERDADIIFLGRRSRPGIRSLIPGSVARNVVARSTDRTVALVGSMKRV